MPDFTSFARQALTGRTRLFLAGVTLAGLAVVAYQHSIHLIGALPYVLLLACPLVHLFMPHGHGSGSHQHDHTNKPPRLPPPG